MKFIKDNIYNIIYISIIFIISYLIIGSDSINTTAVLQRNGYTNIKCYGYSWLIGERAFNRTKFTATAPNGMNVIGAVTYRFNKKNSNITIVDNNEVLDSINAFPNHSEIK